MNLRVTYFELCQISNHNFGYNIVLKSEPNCWGELDSMRTKHTHKILGYAQNL